MYIYIYIHIYIYIYIYTVYIYILLINKINHSFSSIILCLDSVDSFARIQNPGEDSGLKLELNTQQDQYYGQQSTIAGFKIHIHGQNEPPLVKENGFAVMPGTCTFVAVTKTKVIYSLKTNKYYLFRNKSV